MANKNSAGSQAHSKPRIWRVLQWIVIGLVIFVAVAYLGVSAYAANVLTRPARNIDLQKYNPGVYGLAYEDLTFPARNDGLSIAATYIPSEANQRAIILVHGYNNSRTNGFLDGFVSFATKLQEAGFSVLMIDLRGHGQSGDARFTFGIKERWDVLGAVDWLESRGFLPGKIGVLGYSLGAGSIIGAAAEEPDIGAVWTDSLFADIAPVLENGWTSLSGLPQVFLYSTKAMVRLFYGYDIAASRPIEDLENLDTRPIFMAHCLQDKLIPISNMDQLLAIAQNAQSWVIPNCDIQTSSAPPADFPEVFNNHAIGYTLNPDEYTSKVIEFFDASLK
ncbi:MAG TPA: alpha/beta hydrolase [Anaerolineales bacterium]|nr:alpha/beta hydrolase [Anaerolineales bacterium]